MSLEPLWAKGPIIAGHALLALAALGIGIGQLALAKGTARHRIAGYLWVGLMAVVAITGLFIFEIRLIGPFSPIHLLCFLVLGTLAYSLRAVRRGDIRAHRASMTALFWLALVLTGAFTLLPGRAMHAVVFGG